MVRDLGDKDGAEVLLLAALDDLSTRWQSDGDSITEPKNREAVRATVINNLGYHYRCVGKHKESEEQYRAALDLRDAILGPVHNDTIATRHNLAELLVIMGRDDEATTIRKKIMNDVHAWVDGDK